MSEPKQITDGVTPNNEPTRSIHRELIEAIKAQGLNDPDFKYQVRTSDGNTRVNTNLTVEGNNKHGKIINY